MIVWFGFFVALSTFSCGVIWIFYRRSSRLQKHVVDRIKDLSDGSGQDLDSEIPGILRDTQLSKIPILNQFLEKLDLSRKLTVMLSSAGMDMKVGQLLLIIVIFGFMGLLLGLKVQNQLIKLAMIPAMACLPILHIKLKCKERLKAFIRAFPDAIDMMTSAIKAGHAFNQAMQLVGEEAPDPVGVEFKRAFEQYNLGMNMREALLEMAKRIDSLDLKLFVTAILLQRETGGNLTEILVKISYTIRERFKLIGQIKTYTAQGRMSAWILGSLPVAFVLIISALNPGYLEPLFQDQLGHYLLMIAVVLQIIGFFFIQKIIRIRYQ